jgi:adenylate cyclase
MERSREAYQRGLGASRKHLALHPDDARAYVLGVGAFARLGEAECAKEWAERAMLLAPDDDAILYNAGCALAVVGEEERALDALQRAIGAGLAGGDWIPQDPDWEPLRNHPRFQALVERLARR